jgi:hypothetical protein
MKGGSNTLTKILWHNMYDPPCNTPQGHAVARMFLLGNIIIHHLNQLFTAKSNLNSGYPSLKHFRNAANKRSSFHNTLLLIVHAIKNRSCTSIVVSPTSSFIAGVRTRHKDTRTKSVTWGTTTTGATPKKVSTNGTPKYQQIQQNHYYMQGPESAVECQCIELTRKQRVTKGPGVEAIVRSDQFFLHDLQEMAV